MIIRAWLVKLHEKRKKKLSSSANQPINQLPHQPIKPPPRREMVEVWVFVFFLLLFTICLSDHIFLSFFPCYNTLHCLWYSCPHLSLWETQNSQSHNYRTELSISPSINPVGREGTKERTEREEKGMRNSNLG